MKFSGSRRRFMQAGLVGAALLAALGAPGSVMRALAAPPPLRLPGKAWRDSRQRSPRWAGRLIRVDPATRKDLTPVEVSYLL